MLESVNATRRMLDAHFRPVEIDGMTEAEASGSRKHYMGFPSK
jgi:hypothetical protein